MMKPLNLFLVFLVIHFHASAQPSSQLITPIKDSVQSKVLNENRQIWIYVPPASPGPEATRYQVLYLLDAEVFFTLVNGLVHLKSQYERSCAKMIIVGIPNTDRIRDFTPTHSLMSFNGKKEEVMLKTSGGGENFTRFLKEEVIPYVDSKYPTTNKRTLLGHSLAGLLVLNTVVHHPDLFDNYIAIDPSLWWDDQKLLNQATTALQDPKVTGKTLLMAVADDNKARKNPNENSEASAIQKFATEMSDKAKLRFAWKTFSNETHATVVYPALNQSLEMLQ
jgi:uncharacterized protein